MVIAVLAVECVGRKLPMTALMSASAAAIVGLTVVPSTALIALARCGISAAFTVLYVYTPEVCPTHHYIAPLAAQLSTSIPACYIRALFVSLMKTMTILASVVPTR